MSHPAWRNEIIEGASRRDTNDLQRQKRARNLGGYLRTVGPYSLPSSLKILMVSPSISSQNFAVSAASR